MSNESGWYDYTESTNDGLMGLLALHKANSESAARHAHAIEEELLRRIEANGGTELESTDYHCERVVSNSYEQALFQPLLEVLSPEALADCYIPAHQEPVPAKWITAKVKAQARKVGTEALRIVDAAQVPGRPTLRFSRKEKP